MRGKNVAWVVFGLAFVAFAIAPGGHVSLPAAARCLPLRCPGAARWLDAAAQLRALYGRDRARAPVVPHRGHAFCPDVATLHGECAAPSVLARAGAPGGSVSHHGVAVLWLATSEVLLFLLLHLSVVQANQSDPVALFMPVVWGGLAAFLLAIVVGLIAYDSRFQRRPGDVSRKNRRR